VCQQAAGDHAGGLFSDRIEVGHFPAKDVLQLH
jgi:hypothetical protein